MSPNLQSSFYHIIDGTPSSQDHRHNVSTQVSGFCKYPVLVSAAVSVVRHSLSLSLSQQLALYSHIWYQASLLASEYTHRILSFRLLIETFIMEHSLKSFLFSWWTASIVDHWRQTWHFIFVSNTDYHVFLFVMPLPQILVF